MRPGATWAEAVLSAEDWAFLEERRVAHLATADATGRPHVVPVCFARSGDALFVPIDAKPKRGDPRALRRLRNLRRRPQATLLVDRYDEDWRRLRWLMLSVRASILEANGESAADAAAVEDGADAVARRDALAALEARYPQYAAMSLAGLNLPVIRLDPEGVRRWSAGPSSEGEGGQAKGESEP
jgi:PPOX class probable F420-dependent enzyme